MTARKMIGRWMKDMIVVILIKVSLSTSDSPVCSSLLGSSATMVVKNVEQKMEVNRLIPDCFLLNLPARTMLVTKMGIRSKKDQTVENVNRPMKQKSLKIIVGRRKTMRV